MKRQDKDTYSLITSGIPTVSLGRRSFALFQAPFNMIRLKLGCNMMKWWKLSLTKWMWCIQHTLVQRKFKETMKLLQMRMLRLQQKSLNTSMSSMGKTILPARSSASEKDQCHQWWILKMWNLPASLTASQQPEMKDYLSYLVRIVPSRRVCQSESQAWLNALGQDAPPIPRLNISWQPDLGVVHH